MLIQTEDIADVNSIFVFIALIFLGFLAFKARSGLGVRRANLYDA